MIRWRLSASVPSGSRPLTLRAFMPAAAKRSQAALRSSSSARASAAASTALPARCSPSRRVRISAMPGPSASASASCEAVQVLELDVGVAPRAERVGQRLDVPQHRAVLVAREARRVDLEHRAQAPGGDAHVVDALDVGRVEDVDGVLPELLGAHAHRRQRRPPGTAISGCRPSMSRALAIRRRPASIARITPSRTPPRAICNVDAQPRATWHRGSPAPRAGSACARDAGRGARRASPRARRRSHRAPRAERRS